MKKVIQYKNKPLVYFVYGEGYPVILLHGFAETNTVWKNQADDLPRSFKLIIPDIPGSGESVLFDIAGAHLTIEALAESINSILINEEIAQCILLGHSMGGYITLSFAEKYPEKLQAFGLVNSTAFADSEEKKQNRLRGIEIMRSYGGHAFIKNTTPNLFSDAFKQKNQQVVDELIEEGKNFNTENLQQYYYAMMNRKDKTDVLSTSSKPVLFVIGTEDVAAPLKDLLKQVHLPEVSYIHIVENTGHMSMLETPEKLNRILKQFVNEIE
jgi:pimeloyl-ACP methyl ester carboxylesterase